MEIRRVVMPAVRFAASSAATAGLYVHCWPGVAVADQFGQGRIFWLLRVESGGFMAREGGSRNRETRRRGCRLVTELATFP